ncbi:hypothetical protein G5V57_18120 [Nordella sp. HKS 07]|uniref:thermonuclease family protein n=1 Tax=Nordella sp. HKS 07 TaxID=2712222 RepID=UPI0013E1DED9|nr:thermonuclease family protein [Nordella sp. HKS 07]QIG49463.1 hypothetical protein G5V57_18120 [Nordella sp. HKS 07]
MIGSFAIFHQLNERQFAVLPAQKTVLDVPLRDMPVLKVPEEMEMRVTSKSQGAAMDARAPSSRMLFANPMPMAEAPSSKTSVPSAASNIVIIDGDTIAIGRERIRILSIDTPETFHSRCENELVLGLKAKQRLRELLNRGEVRIERDGEDRYRRTLAKVFVGDIDIGETLVREGFAQRYKPGSAAKLQRLQTWCGPDARLNG